MTPWSGRLSFIFYFLNSLCNIHSMNHQITLCSYDVQLSAALRDQLRTIVENGMHLFFNCPKLCNTSEMSILTGIDGYFCENVF